MHSAPRKVTESRQNGAARRHRPRGVSYQQPRLCPGNCPAGCKEKVDEVDKSIINININCNGLSTELIAVSQGNSSSSIGLGPVDAGDTATCLSMQAIKVTQPPSRCGLYRGLTPDPSVNSPRDTSR